MTDATTDGGADPATDPVAPPPRGRVDFLDGVRAAAALYVVAHHIWITTWPDYPRNSGPWSVGWLLYGHIAVSVFIVVSGFSLAIGPARRGWVSPGGAGDFLRRRAWRILPTYWAALLLSAVVYGVITPAVTGGQITARGMLVHAVLLQDLLNTPKPNGAFWSIALECQIYLLFPLMLWLRRRRGPVVLVSVVATVVVAAYLLAQNVPAAHGILNLTPQFVVLFAFGIAAASVFAAGGVAVRGRSLAPALAALCALAFVALCAVQGSVWIDAQYFWIDLLVGAGVAFTLAAMAAHRARALSTVLASAPLRALGRISYSIYCVHLPLLWLVWHFVVAPRSWSAGVSFTALCVVGVPTVLLGSALFSAVFEQPFLRRRSWAAWREVLVSWGPRAAPAVRKRTAPAVRKRV